MDVSQIITPLYRLEAFTPTHDQSKGTKIIYQDGCDINHSILYDQENIDF